MVPPSSTARRRYASTRSRWRAEMIGPQMVSGSSGSPAGRPRRVRAVASTASSYLSRGTSSRVVSAQPCPAWVLTVNAAIAHAPARSASSSTMKADLPPNSRNTFLSVWAAAVMTALPVSVEPVKDTRSTRGSVDSCAPREWSLDVTMLTTPGGKSVSCAISVPTSAAHQGVSGAGLSTTVFPAASAGPSLAKLI